jgi:type IV secretory pathway VirJ component
MLCFLRQSLSQQTIATAGLILEQAMTVASDHGLLTSVRASQISGSLPAPSPVPETVSLPLTALIPRRHADAALMQSSNPLSRSVDIADNRARRLYAAINGRRNVSELSDATELDLKEITRALQVLLDERRIELYTSGGRRVDPAQYFS